MLPTRPYLEQSASWPAAGRHVLAHFDDGSVVVYQAYRPSIARHALEHGVFGGDDFRWSRMSWIKPNFLWMMYRAGWATKPGQEVVLGLRISRAFFDGLLGAAVISSYDRARYATRDAWQLALSGSDVRLQWDPDHDPAGAPQPRRALQLGLRGEALRRFATTELQQVIDMTELIEQQRDNAAPTRYQHLLTPAERVYVPECQASATNVGLDTQTSA